MQDFIRIGGPIVSQPLNENFRRLLNAINIANVNLLYPDENAVVNTLDDMYAIENPQNAQVCYVIASGEMYRYHNAGNGEWVKILDLGNTFRQGFLNSGAVVISGPIVITEGYAHSLTIPDMLLYYKNKEGDAKYLKGMYEVKSQIIDIGNYSIAGVYSIYASMENDKISPEIVIEEGMPIQDIVEKIFIGSFCIVGNPGQIEEHLIFTMPDIAYTGDRGHFYLTGGQASGLTLMASNTAGPEVNRKEGYYYDEGVGYPESPIEEFPVNVDNGANYNVKYFNLETPTPLLHYLPPEGGLSRGLEEKTGIVYDKYWDLEAHELKRVDDGCYTIQQHFVTPNGDNIVLYGTKVYQSKYDAISDINSVFTSDINWLCVESTRMVVGNKTPFDTNIPDCVQFFTMERMSQVGTISPQFADDQFKIYDGSRDNPAFARFDLNALGANYDPDPRNDYRLSVLPYHTVRKYFYADGDIEEGETTKETDKYITEGSVETVTALEENVRNIPNLGYSLADNTDLSNVETRLAAVEREIWKLTQEDGQGNLLPEYQQGIRKRLTTGETELADHETRLQDHELRITSNEQNKVNKATTINTIPLGDTTNKNEAKAVVITANLIDEKPNATEADHWWFTQARVSANTDVVNTVAHMNTVSSGTSITGHITVNPHNLSTDDLRLLTNSDRLFVTRDEKARINTNKLPDDTKSELADLDTRKIEYMPLTKLGGSQDAPTGTETSLGNIKYLRIYEDGCGMTVSGSGNEKTLTLNIRGQRDGLMLQNRYATLEAQYPDMYGGHVDAAVNSEFCYNVAGIEDADANQYYGTNANNEVGIYDLPVYVSTVDKSSFSPQDQVIFVPVDGSVEERHLETSLANKINNNYHKVYDGGTLKSSEINALTFGNNLSVSVNGHTATINAVGSGSSPETKFANLDDVEVTYTGNEGKAIVVNSTGDGVTLAAIPSLTDFMRKDIYVYPQDFTKVRKAVQADNAATATVAENASAVNNKVVNDSDNTSSSLWTASKIISNVSAQIASEGVNTYSGTSTPSSSLGKDGDIYILIEA